MQQYTYNEMMKSIRNVEWKLKINHVLILFLSINFTSPNSLKISNFHLHFVVKAHAVILDVVQMQTNLMNEYLKN